MKKLFIIAVGLVTLVTTSCRQQDEVFSTEDNASLEVLKRTRDTNNSVKDSINMEFNFQDDGDPIPPPKK